LLLLLFLLLLLTLRLLLLFLLCGLGLLLLLFLLLLLTLRLLLLFLLCGLGLLLLLFRLGLLLVMLFLRERRNSHSENQEQSRSADDSKCFHECCLHYRESVRQTLVARPGLLLAFNDTLLIPQFQSTQAPIRTCESE